jgi:hypothetical protein
VGVVSFTTQLFVVGVSTLVGIGLTIGVMAGLAFIQSWAKLCNWITAKLARNPSHSAQTDKTTPPRSGDRS